MNNDVNARLVSEIFRLSAQSSAGWPLSGSYIFAGPDFSGRTRAAEDFVLSIFCARRTVDNQPCRQCQTCRQIKAASWPDVWQLELAADKKNISLDEVRWLLEKLSRGSLLGSYQVALIRQADSLSLNAANALLKTMEEPASRALVILLVQDLDNLPATLVSRSRLFIFRPSAKEFVYNRLVSLVGKHAQARELAALAGGWPDLAQHLIDQPEILAGRQQAAACLISAVSQDANDRLAALDKLLAKAAGQEVLTRALSILSEWRLVVRDWLMIGLGQRDLVSHQGFLPALETSRPLLANGKLLAVYRSWQQAKSFVAANVNPRLVLENFILNFDNYVQ